MQRFVFFLQTNWICKPAGLANQLDLTSRLAIADTVLPVNIVMSAETIDGIPPAYRAQPS